jgi:hypothetical protein
VARARQQDVQDTAESQADERSQKD